MTSKIMAALIDGQRREPPAGKTTFVCYADYVCDGCGLQTRVHFDSASAAACADADCAVPDGWSSKFGLHLCGKHRLERVYLVDGKEVRRESLSLAPSVRAGS